MEKEEKNINNENENEKINSEYKTLLMETFPNNYININDIYGI